MLIKYNEYFDLFVNIYLAGTSEIKKIRESLNEKFPRSFDHKDSYDNDPFMSKFIFRDKLVKIYSWAITCPKAIKEIVKTAKDTGIIEMGAGNGYWASLLANCGVDVIAYDNSKDRFITTYFQVHHADSKLLPICKNRALFLCWPPYDTPMAYDCVSRYEGNTLIYIGEDEGGCTANDDFFKYVSNNFKLDNIIRMLQWEGIHDDLYIYRR